MLPDILKDSYKQYKTDTDRFATWLVNVAKNCGLQPTNWPSDDATNGQTGGRAKKGRSNPATPPQYRATISELRELANGVAESTVDVPTSILAIAKRAIALRKDVTLFFLGRGNALSNVRHVHFIKTMDDICRTLERKSANPPTATRNINKNVETAASTGGSKKPPDAEGWVNRFAALTVEEAEDLPETISSRKEVIKVEAVEDDEGDSNEEDKFYSEGFFKLFCLFHDLKNWRSFISETWKEYAELKIDLMSASVVTDTALQLARDLIQEATASLPDFIPRDGLWIQHAAHTAARIERDGPSLSDMGLSDSEDVDDMDEIEDMSSIEDVSEWCYLGIGALLEAFLPVIADNSIAVYKAGYFGTYNPRADRAKMSPTERFNEDKLLLMEVLPEFAMLNEFNITLPVQDEITMGFVDFIGTKKPTLWLCFAAQIMLDAHHAVRHSRTSVFADIRMSGLRITKTIDDYLKFSQTHPRPQFWPKEGDEEVKRIRECIDTFIEKDILMHFRQLAVSDVIPTRKTTSENLLLSRNPVLSGLFMFHLNLRMQTIGQNLVTQWYDVQQLAFLYNLIQKIPGNKLTWPDLELFLKIHGESHIFVGGRPKDAAESLNRLEIATGISSVARFASNSRRAGQDWHRPDRKNARLLESTTKAANLFRARYQDGGAKKASKNVISSANICKLLDELSDSASASDKERKSSKKKGGNLELALSSPLHLLKRKWHNTHNIGALQLLALIKGKLCEEEPVLMFDYFTMHKRSIEVFRLIREKEHHKFVQYFTSEYMPDESFIANIVILIHHVARGSAQAGQQMGLTKGGNQLTSRIIMSCGDVMKDFLSKNNNGDTVGKSLRTFCKNKRQLTLKESSQPGQETDANRRFMYWFGLEEVLDPKAMESLKTGIPIASQAEGKGQMKLHEHSSGRGSDMPGA